jgi:hypothetical protein
MASALPVACLSNRRIAASAIAAFLLQAVAKVDVASICHLLK